MESDVAIHLQRSAEAATALAQDGAAHAMLAHAAKAIAA